MESPTHARPPDLILLLPFSFCGVKSPLPSLKVVALFYLALRLFLSPGLSLHRHVLIALYLDVFLPPPLSLPPPSDDSSNSRAPGRRGIRFLFFPQCSYRALCSLRRRPIPPFFPRSRSLSLFFFLIPSAFHQSQRETASSLVHGRMISSREGMGRRREVGGPPVDVVVARYDGGW